MGVCKNYEVNTPRSGYGKISRRLQTKNKTFCTHLGVRKAVIPMYRKTP